MLLSTPAQVALVDMPPVRPSSVGRLAFYVDQRRAGEVYVQVCAACRLGVVHGVRATIDHRRDLALLAITTLLERHPDYAWTTTLPPTGADVFGLWAAIGLPPDDAPHICEHMRPQPLADNPDMTPSAPSGSHREGTSMSSADAESGREHSVEELADRRTRDAEFAEVMQLLRASPRTNGLSDDDLEQRARAAWAKFDDAPVRSFVPVLVEREVLRDLPRRPDTDD